MIEERSYYPAACGGVLYSLMYFNAIYDVGMAKYTRYHRYNKTLAKKVCERLSNGESLNAICRDVGMPSRRSIYQWLKTNTGFWQQYALARELQAEMFAEQIIDLADGVDVNSVADIHKVKLQIEARKWFATKVAPRKFYDALLIESNSNVPTVQVELSPAQAYQRMLEGVVEQEPE